MVNVLLAGKQQNVWLKFLRLITVYSCKMKRLGLDDTLYEKDTYKWAMTQARLIRKDDLSKVDLSKVDWENVAEEIESLGRYERRKLKYQMVRLLMYLLKCEYTNQENVPSHGINQ